MWKTVMFHNTIAQCKSVRWTPTSKYVSVDYVGLAMKATLTTHNSDCSELMRVRVCAWRMHSSRSNWMDDSENSVAAKWRRNCSWFRQTQIGHSMDWRKHDINSLPTTIYFFTLSIFVLIRIKTTRTNTTCHNKNCISTVKKENRTKWQQLI